MIGLLLAMSGANVEVHAMQDEKVIEANTYPEWFRDGKLGIWAHWGPQSVPMQGDWYARRMYQEGSEGYLDHLKRYGHPSEKGWKDVVVLWKAEKWDPERLMKMYKAAGAKYFVSMGVHHDNFDLWNSKYNRWNAVNMGPHRDVVGEWQKAAKANGLKFGVSEHLGASFTWFQVARGADKAGPKKGVPYDGNDPAYEDLYHAKSKPGDTGWYTNDESNMEIWEKQIMDLVTTYKPDLLYSDGPFPFGAHGEKVVSTLYSQNRGPKGEQETVYNCKQPSGGKWVQDVERGVLAGIQDVPWQIDTSIGDWFYNVNWKYRDAAWVLHTLVDVVSKNGNLLINVVQRPDGSLDPEAEKVLADMAAWMKVNSESIYGTRPWVTYGEGPTKVGGGAFKEDYGFTAKDVRYVSKGNGVVYATLLGKPSGEVVFKALAKEGSGASVKSVSVLGSSGKTEWKWEDDGLHVMFGAGAGNEIATVVKVAGSSLKAFVVREPDVETVTAEGDGSFLLTPEFATLGTGGIRTEDKGGKTNLGYWDNESDHAVWKVKVDKPGQYSISAEVACEQATQLGWKIVWAAPGERKEVSATEQIPATGGFETFQNVDFGSTVFLASGTYTFTAFPVSHTTWHPLNLRTVVLKRE